MRWFIAGCVILTGCESGLKFNTSEMMTSEEMLDRATLVFVGVIERHTFVSWPFLSIPGQDPKYWRLLQRQVRIEAIARGNEPRKVIDAYEFFWAGGATGNWNATQDNQRYLFLVRMENGKYHVVRDWWRSIFPVGSGWHDRFPLDESRSVWERAALLQYWVGPGYSAAFPTGSHVSGLSPWRTAKLLRGLLRYPDPAVRLAACEELLLWGRSQDECFEQRAPEEKTRFGTYYNRAIPANEWTRNRLWEKNYALQDWERLRRSSDSAAMDDLKLFTTVNNYGLRRKFCGLYQTQFPQDRDNGCPANQPPPATIVTVEGDMPMIGSLPIN